MNGVGVDEICSAEKECLQPLLGPRYHRRVIAEEQAAEHRHGHDSKQIEPVSVIPVVHWF